MSQMNLFGGKEPVDDPWAEACAVDDPWAEACAVPLSTVQARYYQTECCDAVKVSLAKEDVDSTLVTMATGLGKTVVASLLAADTTGRVLFLAHRDELLTQSRKALEHITGEWTELEQANVYAGGARIVVGSVQSIHREKRLARFDPSAFDLIICDEAHHATAGTYRKIFKHFKGRPLVGLTATADRGDQRALGQVFSDVAYEYDIADGIADGFLSPLRAKQVHLDEINLDNVKVTGGELQGGQLDEEMVKAAHGVVAGILEHAPERTGIGFFPGVNSAELATKIMNEKRPGSAVFICGETDKDLRRELVDRFKRGDAQYLFNVGVATEGFDAPRADMVIMARPTKSRGFYTQCVGRITRPWEGILDGLWGRSHKDRRIKAIARSPKPNGLILDFAGTTQHSLCGPADVLAGKYDDDVVERAKRKLKSKPGGDPVEMLEEAKREEDEHQRKLHAAAVAKARVKSRVSIVDPFAIAGYDEGAASRIAGLDKRYGSKPCTPNQKRALMKFGMTQEQAEETSYRQAGVLLDGFIKRMKGGAGHPKAVGIIQKFIPAPNDLSKERTDHAMTYLRKNDWGRGKNYDPGQLEVIVFAERQPGEEG